MYWGSVSATQDEPNRGTEAGNIVQPIWTRANQIVVRSARIDQGQVIRGLFEVAIDSTSLSFKGVSALAFPYVIRDCDYDPLTDSFLVTYSKDPNSSVLARAVAQQGALAIADTLLGEAWHPLCARCVGMSGVIAYAHSPITQVDGFYYVDHAALVDSMVNAVELSIPDARGFDVAGGTVCYGVTDDLATDIWKFSFPGPNSPVHVAHLEGSFVSSCVHPDGTCAAITTEEYGVNRGQVVRLLNLASGVSKKIEMQTKPCGFVIADFATWNPTGDKLAFSASAFNGEGQVFPRELWLRKNLSCRSAGR